MSQYYSTKSAINNSQNQFYALNTSSKKFLKSEDFNLEKYNLSTAEEQNELKHLASVATNEDNIIRDSLKYIGPRILTFSSIIKYNSLPLNNILKHI